MTPTTPRPTPETDAFILPRNRSCLTQYEWREHGRRLERERDEAREQLQAMRKEHDEVRANYVAMCSRLQECVQEHGIGLGGEKLDKLVCDEIKLLTKDLEEERHAWQKERENAMADYVAVATQLQAMREAIKEAHALMKAMEAVVDAAKCIRHWHDAGTDGMIVSRGHVFKLWEALAALRENEQAQAALAKLKPFIKP